MASSLLELLKGKYHDTAVGLVEEVNKIVPEIAFFDSRSIMGTQFKTLARTALPKTGFRLPKQGIEVGESTYDFKTFDLSILDGIVTMDKAVALADTLGYESCLTREALGVMQSSFGTLARQTWYGVDSDANGFPGALALVKPSLHTWSDPAPLTAGKGTSIFAVGNGTLDACGYVFTDGQGLLNKSLEWKEQLVTPEEGKAYNAVYTDLTT